MDDELKIHIDGSAITNPGSIVGCAGIVFYPEHSSLPKKELKWPYSSGTSGSMELLALVNAIKWINKNTQHLLDNEISFISILSDSDYVVSSSNSSVYRWSDPFNKNKWKKLDGGTVKHINLWKEFLREKRKSKFKIDIAWIEGKSTQETKDTDKAAKKAARSLIKRQNFEQLPYKQGRSLLGKESKLKLFSDVGKTHLIRVFSHCMVSRKRNSEYEVRFEVIKEDCIKGSCRAFTSQTIGFSNVDRGHYYNATFNNSLTLPWITEIKEVDGEDLEEIKTRVKFIKEKMKSQNVKNPK